MAEKCRIIEPEPGPVGGLVQLTKGILNGSPGKPKFDGPRWGRIVWSAPWKGARVRHADGREFGWAWRELRRASWWQHILAWVKGV